MSELPTSRPYPSPLAPERSLADDFVELACLTFHSEDGPRRRARASALARASSDLSARSFFAAVVLGDVAAVRQVLAADAGAAARPGGPRGWVPLLYLGFGRVLGDPGRCDAIEVARLLLAAGADPNSHVLFHGRYRWSSITGAIGEGESGPVAAPPHAQARALVELLLDAGADPNDSQALYDTHFRRDNSWLALFLARGLGPEHPANWTADDQGQEPTRMLDYMLGQAVNHGLVDRVALLLAHGASPDGRNIYDKRRHLENARLRGHAAVAGLLMRGGATPVVLAPADQLRADMLAADEAAVRKALADPKPIEGRDDVRTLLVAAELGHLPAVQLLLELGVPASASDADGLSALHLAAANGHRLVVDALLARGASLSQRERVYGGTPLGRVTWFSRVWPTPERDEVRRALSERSTDVFDLVFAGAAERLATVLAQDPTAATARRPDGRSPLHVLAEGDVPRHDLLIELLVRHGADVNARTDRGQTPIDTAAEASADDVAAALVAHGATPRPSSATR
jgi:ankyrin repeat protein